VLIPEILQDDGRGMDTLGIMGSFGHSVPPCIK
jgi:hypothetical protein